MAEQRAMISKLSSKLSRRLKRWRFKRSVKRLHDKEFCIVANNCLGSRFYKILKRGYNTPFVGLFMMPECFSKLVSDFDRYMDLPIQFVQDSKYSDIDAARRDGPQYPIGLLNDLEIHFLHYDTEAEATEKWMRRVERMRQLRRDDIYFVMIANGACEDDMIERFFGEGLQNKIYFHRRKELERPGCVYIPSKEDDMGNLYAQYQRFVGRFDFADWILGHK